jgi:hypothetical protein
MTDLAPIVLFVYDRPWHTEQVLNALKKNELADQSKLFIYVDGPKCNASSEQLAQIEELHTIIQKEQWCKEVEIILSKSNIGCRNSIINGITAVLENYEAVIVLEDDIVTSPYFLRYMNTALNYYKDRVSVFSISGYNLPENRMAIPVDYNWDVYASKRLLNWGWGTWKSRWTKANWEKNYIPNFLKEKEQVEAFNRGGDDLSVMLLDEFQGKSDAWDIQFAFTHFMHHAISIVPCHSYVKNIGLDGTGTHVPKGVVLDNDLSLAVENPRFLDVLYEDKRIINAFYNAFTQKKRPLWQKAINRLCRMFGRKNIFVIKKKIYC